MSDLYKNDDQISNFITDVSRKRIRDFQMELSPNEVASIAYNASQVTETIKSMMKHPSKQQIERFKDITTDKRILQLLKSNDVSLGLELKTQYDLGRLDSLERILQYEKQNGLGLEHNPILKQFIKDSEFFLPPKPKIDDADLKNEIEANIGLTNYTQLGRSYFNNILNCYLIHRFPGRNVEELAKYANNHIVASRWARFYEMSTDIKVAPFESFFAYIGALASQIQLGLDNLESEIKNWVTILLEPILMQFDEKKKLKINAKDEIRSLLGNDNIEFRNVFTSTSSEPIFLVQIYAYDNVLLATSSSDSLADAEARASTIALLNTKSIDKIKRFNKKLNETEEKVSLSPQVRDPSPTIQHRYLPQPQSYTGYGSFRHSPTPISAPNIAVGHSPHLSQSKAVVQTAYGGPLSDHQTPRGSTPQNFLDQDYHRLFQPSNGPVFECPLIGEDVAIDTSSKEKLNQLLIKSRINPAEYKTDKLNNSDVQVTCYVDSVPIAKAVSSNKKRAGQICAYCILSRWHFFLDRLNKFKQQGK